MQYIKGKHRLVLAFLLILFITYPFSSSAYAKVKFKNLTSNTVLTKGSKYKIKYKRTGKHKNSKVSFKSSDKKIATVSKKGVIRAKKKGRVKITIYIKNDRKVKNTAKIYVGKKIKTLQITGYKTDYVMQKGESKKLKCVFSPSDAANKKVKWKSSDQTIATVSEDGIVKAKKAGTVSIKAVSRENGKVLDREKIRIGKRVSSLEVSGADYLKSGSTMILKTEIKPSSSLNQKLKWSSSDKSIATVSSSGEIEGIKPGTVTITARTTDGSGISFKKNIEVFKMFDTDTRWIAHRGLNTEATENTERAFELAGEYGFWGCECDIHETKHDEDGSFDFAVNHDNDFNRVFGVDKMVSEMTRKEIEADENLSEVCFLKDYLEICMEYNMVPIIELKSDVWSDEGIEKLVDMVYDMDEGELLSKSSIISFDGELLSKVRKYEKEKYSLANEYLYIVSSYDADENFENVAEYVNENGFTGVCLNRSLMNSDVDSICTENDFTLNIWTYVDTATSNAQMYEHIIKNNYNIYSATINGKLFEHAQ